MRIFGWLFYLPGGGYENNWLANLPPGGRFGWQFETPGGTIFVCLGSAVWGLFAQGHCCSGVWAAADVAVCWPVCGRKKTESCNILSHSRIPQKDGWGRGRLGGWRWERERGREGKFWHIPRSRSGLVLFRSRYGPAPSRSGHPLITGPFRPLPHLHLPNFPPSLPFHSSLSFLSTSLFLP